MDSRPSLTLVQTVSNPHNDIEVVGFTGTNTSDGSDALVLKADSIPTDETRVAVYAKIANTEWDQLFILGDDVVYGMPRSLFEDKRVPHTVVGPNDESITPDTVHWEDFETWEKRTVEIST